MLPFEWGADYLPSFAGWTPGDDSRAATETLHDHSDRALARSEDYFAFEARTDHVLDDRRLRFTSAATTGVPENDVVHADYFPSPGGPAVVVVPQWNAKEGAQEGLCRLLNRFGITTLKLALPYQERRKPRGLLRADFTLSPNIGRTLQSCRQAVLDARACVAWLADRGHHPLGIVGTSLGSCVAFITFAHEPRLDVGVFNHISPFFADVVWEGISTRHVREGLERGIDLRELRKLWLPLSPFSYYDRVKLRARPSLLVHGKYDLSFPPNLSRELLQDFEARGIEHESVQLPCGHYTTAKFPFNWMDGLCIARFLKRRFAQKK